MSSQKKSAEAAKIFETLKRLDVLQTDIPEDESCMTFVLNGEDHTLGNALRHVIMKNPETEFCGYAVPHPSERKINLRIQGSEGKLAVDLLRDGLSQLKDVCNHVANTFDSSVATYRASHKQDDQDCMETT
ncbi:DNA-directed RNA polymerases I and III subunit RPAC2-like [Corticium candelabrum]|uniref:DNA-directed RNA polymerases I and III subunit RPAC2-like n=1 Tax=Corticium candelabrum TaxID=121492 RepID=UPI002E252767|nr:DNA-directed RNA polymerases I and III subunit RPAC2-like [Corticium candelabrum]